MNLLFERIRLCREKSLLPLSCLSVSPSVRLSATFDSAPTGRISVKFDSGDVYETLSRKSKFN